jgi:glucose-6-phosphate 1-epimerase
MRQSLNERSMMISSENQIHHQQLGAQVLNYQDFFYLSPLVLGAEYPRRGGVPILFPQFADRGALRKHGFVRDIVWKVVFHQRETYSEHLRYELNLTSNNLNHWPHKVFIQLDVFAKLKSITFSLMIKSLGNTDFVWTGGFHPYFKIENLMDIKIDGLMGCEIENKYRPEQTHQLEQVLLFDEGPCESLFFSNSNLVIHDAKKIIYLSSKGFSEWMIWNPGKLGVKDFSDIPHDDWTKFLCIEPVNVKQPQLIKVGSQFIGDFTVHREIA